MRVLNLEERSGRAILDSITSFCETNLSFEKGQNILVEIGPVVSLLKYENVCQRPTNPHYCRLQRLQTCHTGLSFFEPLACANPKRKTVGVEILGTHRMDFTFDVDMQLYLPSAQNHTDLYLDLAHEFRNGSVTRLVDTVSIVDDERAIKERLQQITRPAYFERNVMPFLEGRPTDLSMPSEKSTSIRTGLTRLLTCHPYLQKPLFFKFDTSQGLKWLANVAKDLNHGDFVYVGSQEEVYLLGVAKDESGELLMQGSDVASSKPVFWFSNNYLSGVCAKDVSNPSFHAFRGCSSGTPISQDIPSFNGKPFIFSAMGREQDFKNMLFTGEPDIITGNVTQATNHFRHTDFAEFVDVLHRYEQYLREPVAHAK